jgi:hypothetical protein
MIAPPEPRRCARCAGPLPMHYPPCPPGIGLQRAPSTRPPAMAEDDQRESPRGLT